MFTSVYTKFIEFPNWFKMTIIIFVVSILSLLVYSSYLVIEYIILIQDYKPDPSDPDPPLLGLKLVVAMIYGLYAVIIFTTLVGLLKGWNLFRYLTIIGAIVLIYWGFPITIPFSLIILYALLFDSQTIEYFGDENKVATV